MAGYQLGENGFAPDKFFPLTALGSSYAWVTAWVPCVGFFWILWFSPNSPKHASRQIDYTTLPLGVDECVHDGLVSHPWWIVFTHPVFLGEEWIPSGYPRNLSRVKDYVKMRRMQYLPPAIRKPVEMPARQSDVKTMHLIKQGFFPITSYSIMILQNRSRMINPRLFFAALLWPTTTGCVSQNSFTFVQYLLLNTIFVLPLLHTEALMYKFQVSPSYDVISVSKKQNSILKQDLFQYSWNPLAKIINHTGWMKNSKKCSRKNMWCFNQAL